MSKYINRYPDPGLVKYLLKVPQLYGAPDLSRDHPAFILIHRWHQGWRPQDVPYVEIGPQMTWAIYDNAVLCKLLLKALGKPDVTVVAGGEPSEAGYKSYTKTTEHGPMIIIGHDEPIVAIHEAAHVLFGPSEATAVGWSERVMKATA